MPNTFGALYDKLMGWRKSQQTKHDQGDSAAVDSLNELTNEEFLAELSEALEEILSDFKKKFGA